MSDSGSVLVIAAANSRLYKHAESIGCEVFPRGWEYGHLEASLQRTGRPPNKADNYDLVVLDGHGHHEEARFCSGLDIGVPLELPEIAAPAVALSVCWGGADHYVRAVRANNPGTTVIGPTGTISRFTYRETLIPLIEYVRCGTEPKAAMERILLEDRRRHVQLWQVVS